MGPACTPLLRGATSKGEVCKSIVVGKMVHVPVGELDAVVEVLQQQMYLKAYTENWKVDS